MVVFLRLMTVFIDIGGIAEFVGEAAGSPNAAAGQAIPSRKLKSAVPFF
jgi:hypothetical protein